MMVAVLFARADSHYKAIGGCDVWDIDRDARNFTLDRPVVVHPPCRGWGHLKGLAKPRWDELDLARWAVMVVRHCGGVLEHPSGSSLFKELRLPRPGSAKPDEFGGYTYPVSQKWWGHRAEKKTWLYFCGVRPADLPPLPFSMAPATHTVTSQMRDVSRRLPKIGVAEREHTPPDMAAWLCELASRCRPS